MGHNVTSFGLQKEHELKLSAPLAVLAGAEHVEGFKSRMDAAWLPDVTTIPVELDEELPLEKVSNDGLLVIEVDPSVPSSMQRIHTIRERFPDLAVVVAMKAADLSLVRTLIREGVSDVVSLPLSPEEIFQTIVAIFETSQKRHVGSQVAEAPVIAVTRALGGTGATTLASHLAAALAEGGSKVCVFDLDIQFGHMADVLGLQPRRTLSDLLEAGDRIDADLFRSVATSHESGISLVAAPTEILPIESVREKDISRAIRLAQSEYDYVVLDLPTNLTNWVLLTLSRADRVVMTCQQTITSLQHTKRMLDLFGDLGLDTRLVSIVPNRVERKMFGSISLSDVEKALRHDVEAGISLDLQAVQSAQDQGVLVSDIKPKSSFASDIRKLNAIILDRLGRENDR